MIQDQIIPASVELERELLATILGKNAFLMETQSKLTADDFFFDGHRRIYSAMCSLSESGDVISDSTLIDRLEGSLDLQAVGGSAYIHDLSQYSAFSVASHIRAIVRKSKLRRIVQTCENVSAMALSHGATDTECLARLSELTHEIASSSTEVKTAREIVDRTLGELIAARKRDDDWIGLPIGIPSVDESTGGIAPGEFWIVGARPGRGKTAVGAQAIVQCGLKSIPILVFSIEMRDTQIMRRIFSQVMEVPNQDLRRPKWIKDVRFSQIQDEAVQVAQWPLYVDDSSGISIDQLVAKAALCVKRYKIELIVVDYIGRIACPKGRDEVEKTLYKSRALAQLAKDYAPVLALSQLSRPEAHNIRSRPNMTQLIGSSALESDAHTILLIHRDMDKENRFTGVDEIIIEKQREGRTGSEPVTFDDKYLRYLPREWRGQ